MAIQKYDFSGKHGSAYRGGQDVLFQRAMRAAMKVLPTRGIAPIPAAGGGGGRRGNGGGSRVILALPDGDGRRWPRKKKKVASKKRFPKRAGKKYTGSVTNPLYQRAIADALRVLRPKKKRGKKRGKKRASAAQLAARKRFAAAAKSRARAGKKRSKSKKPRAASRKARTSSVTAAQVIAMAKKYEQRRRLIASKTRKKIKSIRDIVC